MNYRREVKRMMFECYATGSDGNCYSISDGCGKLLLDCGIAYKQILKSLDYNIMDVVGCCITHHHQDHAKAEQDLRLNGIPIFDPYNIPVQQLINWKDYYVRSVPLISNDRWLHTNGDGSECPVCGFLINHQTTNILYMTDFQLCPYRFKRYKLQTLILGCNYEDEIEIDNDVKNYHVRLGHSALSTVKEIVRVNKNDKLRHVILCHLSSSADRERMQREVQEVVGAGVTVDIATPGVTVDLGDTPF